MKRLSVVLALLLLLVLPLFAQDDLARGALVRADYGSGDRWVDVTQRVHSLLRGDSLNFRVDNNTLGIDPRPGQVKELRLQFRDNQGRTRQMTFRENQFVALRVNADDTAPWAGSNTPANGACFYRDALGNQGFCLQTGQSLSDMPSGFNDKISSIQVFGDAVVTVFHDSGFSGARQTFSSSISDLRYATGNNWNDRISSIRVDRSDGSGYYGGDLRITRAIYGAGNRLSDVTNRLNSQVRGNQLNLQVTNNTMGGDPNPNQAKTLRIQYTYNGRPGQLTVNEGGYLRLPDSSAGYQGDLQITRAVYGAGNRLSDVTNRLNSQVRNNQLNLQVTNDTMGGDPNPNQAKTLTVQYTYNGRSAQSVINEGGYLNLPEAGGYYGERSYDDGSLQITRAQYGSENRMADVTNRLNSQVRNNQLSLQVTNDTMGGDPSPNRSKTLTVQYTFNGRPGQTTVNEGGYLRLPDGSASYQGNLQIVRADYGAGNRFSDVTNRLSSRVQNNQINIRVTNDTMGGDPNPGQNKTLTVQYLYDGNRRQAVVNEGNTLNLPEYNASAGQILRCESSNNARNYCPAYTRGGVRLTRQTMGSSCIQGSTWGYDNGGVWVDRGCRGEFEVLSSFGADSGSMPYGNSLIVPSGTQLAIRTNEVIDSASSAAGQTFSAQMYADVLDSSGAVVIPRGSDVALVIRSTEGNDLVLDIDSVLVAGQRYSVSTSDLQQQGRQGIGANRRTATMVGGGAAIGAIIGAIVGGGTGAAIGAGVGAAGGAGAEVLTQGKQVRVPAETILNFRLDTDLRLQARW